jgi:DDE superfamily endonuclease/homeodomain-containing protein
LAAAAGATDEVIARTLGVAGATVYRTRRRLVVAGLEAALSEMPRPGAERKLTGNEAALLVATACSKPPAGRAHWTLELLAGEMVRLTSHDRLSRETVGRRLTEEEVLELYNEAPDPKRPVVCFDESPTQLIGEVREPIAAKPGQTERSDCEYRRTGTANLFVLLDAHHSWRKVKVTERRAAVDFALCLCELVDLYFPDAEKICLVLDNLSTHSALYQTFPAPEARRLLRRLEFHYTPKHANWLNMVEVEIGALRSQCLDRRIDNRQRLEAEIAHWERQRNQSGARIKWMFTADKARTKMARAYPIPAHQS